MNIAKHKKKTEIVTPFRIDGPECLEQLNCVRWTSTWVSGRRFHEGMNRLARMLNGRLNYPYIFGTQGDQFIAIGDVLVPTKSTLLEVWHEQDFFENFEEVDSELD